MLKKPKTMEVIGFDPKTVSAKKKKKMEFGSRLFTTLYSTCAFMDQFNVLSWISSLCAFDVASFEIKTSEVSLLHCHFIIIIIN